MLNETLHFAYQWRKKLGLFEHSGPRATEAIRIFYGPGESAHPELKQIAIDLFKNHAWITVWGKVNDTCLNQVVSFLNALTLSGENTKIASIVFMDRSEVASQADVKTISGTPPTEKFSVTEFGVPYFIKFSETKHPGLFLDHAPLRAWLKDAGRDQSVLNLFSYTGSLSSAAGMGGASRVTTLDLSKSTIEWAEENWKLAGLDPSKGNFIYGDVFEWLPRFLKKNDSYDIILCDPPSFSRSKNGTFSTAKDSMRLHELIFPLLNKGGVLVTSINSENYPEHRFLADIHAAAENLHTKIKILKRVDLPETFPTSSEKIAERYLKGFYILKL